MILALRLHRDENKDKFRERPTWPSFIEDVVWGNSSAKKSFPCFNLELLFSFLTSENCKGTTLYVKCATLITC